MALLSVVTSVLLVGCSSDPTPPPARSAADSTSSPTDPAATRSDDQDSKGAKNPETTPKDPDANADTSAGEPTEDSTPDAGDDPAAGDSASDDSNAAAAGAEMPPLAPEESPTSLSELLAEQNTTPLVTTPLPRAASAVGRMVKQFPPLLRTVRRSAVESSGISPSGDRLQVALVASTKLSPDQVLLAFRTRFARRGLLEQATPLAVPGSRAAAFRRGRSSVTLTVTKAGNRTSYSVHATLHPGGT